MPANTAARHVLYVEDDRINLVLMEEVFRRLPGWQLDVAEDGAEALQRLDDLRPDLVLIDMNLPDMNGMQLLRSLRERSGLSDLPCVALSADGLPEQIQAAQAAGFMAYWLKPIEVPRLVEALRAL